MGAELVSRAFKGRSNKIRAYEGVWALLLAGQRERVRLQDLLS